VPAETGWKYGFPAFGSNEKRQRVESPTFQAIDCSVRSHVPRGAARYAAECVPVVQASMLARTARSEARRLDVGSGIGIVGWEAR